MPTEIAWTLHDPNSERRIWAMILADGLPRQMPIEISTPSTEIAKKWLELYKKSPTITAIFSLLVAALGITLGVYSDRQQKAELEGARLKNLSYSAQVQSLDQTRSNLAALIEFVDAQKKQLELSDSAVRAMKSEEEKLKPLLQADRNVINALFEAQEARNQAGLSKERWIGIGLGILASLIASVIYAATAIILKRKRMAVVPTR